jgi:peptide/nickel transport system ATP-binding protein
MYLGKIVETGTTEQVIGHPKHPYTQALISVVPSPDPRKKVERVILKGERPDPVDIPTGCRFHPRCPLAFERCGWNSDEVVEELRSAVASGQIRGVGTIQAQGPRKLGIAVAAGVTPSAAAQDLRAFVDANRGARLCLKGIEEVRESGGYVYVSLHSWSEPLLVELAPANEVACHLLTPPPEVPESVTA